MYRKLEDLELISIVKSAESGASAAMNEIITRHSGIFIDMINHYVPCNSPFCNKGDLIDEKEYYIYKALIKYDPDRGTKFSTHLGNEAKWLCLNTYNKNKNRLALPSSHTQYDVDTAPSPVKEISKQESFKKIIDIIDSHPDKRVQKIFSMRYIEGEKNKVMPWKRISAELKMSIQGCINIHNSAIKKIQNKMTKEC